MVGLHSIVNFATLFFRYAIGRFTPPIDSSSNISNVSVSRTELGSLVFMFSRQLDTGDAEGDIALTGCLYLLYAYGGSLEGPDTLSIHASRTVSQETVCFPPADQCSSGKKIATGAKPIGK